MARKDQTHIPTYKFRRLPSTFWKTWKNEIPGKSIQSHLYSLITHMVMQRFKDSEITRLIYSWHSKYSLEVNSGEIAEIITAVKIYTLTERRRLKTKEMRRYRAKKKVQAEAALLGEVVPVVPSENVAA